MSELDVFMETCSVGVHPQTVAQIVEYAGPPDMNILRILTTEGAAITAAVDSKNAEISKAIKEIEKGSAVSIGVMQVSSNYWLEYDVTVFDMVEPCTNITVGTSILAKEYLSILESTGDQHGALKISLQKYLEGNLYITASAVVEELFNSYADTLKIENEREHWGSHMRVSGFVARTENDFKYPLEAHNNDS